MYSPLLYRSEMSSEGDGGRDRWGHDLPEDVLITIFKMLVDTEGFAPFLATVPQVNTFWRQVSLLPDVWRQVRLEDRQRYNSRSRGLPGSWDKQGFLRENRFRHVHVLDTGLSWLFCDSKLQVLTDHFEQITELSITLEETATNFVRTLANLPHLHTLRLTIFHTRPSFPTTNPYDRDSVEQFTSKLGGQLRELRMNTSDPRVQNLYNGITTQCPRLQVLHTSGSLILPAGTNLPELQVLQVDEWLRPAEKLDPHRSPLPSLTTLRVHIEESSCRLVSNHAMKLARMLTTTNKLELDLHSNVSTKFYTTPFINDLLCTNLTSLALPISCTLNFSDNRSNPIAMIIRKWHHSLEQLTLFFVGAYTQLHMDVGFQQLRYTPADHLRHVVLYETITSTVLRCLECYCLSLTDIVALRCDALRHRPRLPCRGMNMFQIGTLHEELRLPYLDYRQMYRYTV